MMGVTPTLSPTAGEKGGAPGYFPRNGDQAEAPGSALAGWPNLRASAVPTEYAAEFSIGAGCSFSSGEDQPYDLIDNEHPCNHGAWDGDPKAPS